MPDLLLCGRRTFWQNKAFSWHWTPLEFLLVCINPAYLSFPHISNAVTFGVVDLWWSWSLSVPMWWVPHHHWRLFGRNETRRSFIHYFKIISHLPCLLQGRSRGDKIDQFWKDWKYFVEWKWEYFLQDVSFSSFSSSIMIIKFTGKVYICYFVFREMMVMMTMTIMTIKNVLSWLSVIGWIEVLYK